MESLIVIFGVALLAGFFLLFLFLGKSSPESALLARVTSSSAESEGAGHIGRGSATAVHVEWLGKFVGGFRRLFGGTPDPGVVRRLSMAGYRKPAHYDIFIGSRILLPVVGAGAVALYVKNNVLIWFLIALVVGFFIPDFWLSRAISKRAEEIRLALPDMLDLLAICMEAGLGLDQAILRVGEELHLSHPELSDELQLIVYEQRAGGQRVEAWRHMADRVGVESVRSFVNMLVQTERFGTPISKSLATFSDALRVQRRQQVEEAAAKTTIKLVLPLVFFIFPSIFIVTVAPAVITLMKSFGTVI